MTRSATSRPAYAIPPPGDRPFDICIFGCTGNAGRAVAHHVLRAAVKAPHGNSIRVALAGRSRDKVERLLQDVGPSGTEAEVVIADANDAESMLKMAMSTRVLVCCAGPYGLYGEPAVKACVEAGAHYVDITGEVPWVERMAAEYGSRAEEKGVALLSFSGYDCVPSEVMMSLVGRALEKKGEEMGKLDLAFYSAGGGMPHGTMETVIGSVEGSLATSRRDGDPSFVPSAYEPALNAALSPLGFVLPKWSSQMSSFTGPNFMAAINAPVLCHSASLLGFRPDLTICDRQLTVGTSSSALSLYGLVPSALYILSLGLAGIFVVFPPTRWWLKNKLKTYSYGGDLNCSTKAFGQGTASGNGGSVAMASMKVPGDPGIYATGLFATAVSLSLLETTASGSERKETERPLAGFHPPVAALDGCGKGILVKNLRKLGAEIKVSVKASSSSGKEEEIDAEGI